MIPTWRDYKEEEVLCQRVAEGLKPLASIVIYDDKHLEWVYSLVLQHGLLCFEYMNSWDVLVINIIRDKDTTLGSLMTNVERKIFQKVEPKASAICKLKLSRYLNCDSPDIFKGECGLAYGYNLIEKLRLCSRFASPPTGVLVFAHISRLNLLTLQPRSEESS